MSDFELAQYELFRRWIASDMAGYCRRPPETAPGCGKACPAEKPIADDVREPFREMTET